jgi:hypothetical protein
MQRLFTMFPNGLPGIALFILRLSVTVALLPEVRAQQHAITGVTIILSAALCAGVLTPICAVAALATHIAVWCVLGPPNIGVAAMVVLDIAALALLGPGAYSVDSRRFGRRTIVLPP